MRLTLLSGEDVLATQHLKRWHMVRVRRQQTLADHQGSVASFAAKILALWYEGTSRNRPDPELMLEVLDYALTHDSHEVEYGDTPSPAVRAAEGTHAALEDSFWTRRGGAEAARPSPFAAIIVKIADKLDAQLFYELEGEDPRFKKWGEEGIRQLLAEFAAPSIVREWIEDMIRSVRAGAFAPQPPRA